MILEKLTLVDVSEAIDVAEGVHKESIWSKIPYDKDVAITYTNFMLNHPQHGFIYVLKEEGKIVGGFVATINRFPFSNAKYSDLYILYIKREFRGAKHAIALVKKYIEEAKTYNVIEIHAGINTPGNFEKVERLFKWCGFKHTGSAWNINV